MGSSSPEIRCRQIEQGDVAAVAELLIRGFPNRSRQFWYHALDQLSRREPPHGLPKYGYLIDVDREVAGAILLICAEIEADGKMAPRCNLSSWYVDPDYRAYAPLLVSQALRHKEVTYLNVSAAPHTWPIIEAQGFSRYSNGIFISLPILSATAANDKQVEILDSRHEPRAAFEPFEQEVLEQHAEHGCISIWCETPERAFPFVFRPRLVRGFVPCVQLIYCRDVADFVRFARPIGRHLAKRGRFLAIVDANGPIEGLVGIFRPGSKPKYFRGPQRPRLGDLAYTEYAILGV
ncbi:MAG TPA: acyl-CoA acyltransferase [Xanthobacteraceae bacterium]|jgi:hypothetical protein|nr:acyl-CoA acyltransferase [Xanthobacteraceae bacterium]